MNRQQSGFTLIELIAVIVILGILAATAVPKFVNMQTEASLAATKGVAGSLESGSTLNHAVDIAVAAGLTNTTNDPFYNITDCDGAAVVLQTGALPTGYSIASLAVADGANATCTLTGPNSQTWTFVVIGALGGL